VCPLIDLHCHILRYVIPVHRTVPDIEVAVRMAEMAAADGVTIIVATPHFREQHMETGMPEIAEGVARLNEVLAERGVDIEVVGGAEVQMSEKLPELARRGLLPTLGGGSHVLVELPMMGHAFYAEHVLFELALQGLTPVLAHFERTATLPVGALEAEEMVARGYALQVNCRGLLGGRGEQVTALARRLVREGLASVLASDCHDCGDRAPGLTRCRRLVEQLGGLGAFEELTWENPARILGRT